MASETNSKRWVFACAGLTCCAAPAIAGADLELGRYLASECMTCHRAQAGASNIPDLSRLPPAHIIEVMKAYRARTLPHAAMQNVAGRLTDDDIESLALYFSTVTKR